jgi:hypothetical protein
MREEPWQRLTLLDMLLLFPAHALGLAAIGWMRETSRQSLEIPRPWPADATFVGLLLAGLVVGSVIAGPIILLSQWLFRRRRARLSPGEWLWLGPTAIYLCVRAAFDLLYSTFGWATPLWYILFAGGVLVCSLMASAVICLRLVGERDTAPCLWTDLFGGAACVLAGALLVYTLIVDPLRI